MTPQRRDAVNMPLWLLFVVFGTLDEVFPLGLYESIERCKEIAEGQLRTALIWQPNEDGDLNAAVTGNFRGTQSTLDLWIISLITNDEPCFDVLQEFDLFSVDVPEEQKPSVANRARELLARVRQTSNDH